LTVIAAMSRADWKPPAQHAIELIGDSFLELLERRAEELLPPQPKLLNIR